MGDSSFDPSRMGGDRVHAMLMALMLERLAT
jgi:hypothetical protein